MSTLYESSTTTYEGSARIYFSYTTDSANFSYRIRVILKEGSTFYSSQWSGAKSSSTSVYVSGLDPDTFYTWAAVIQYYQSGWKNSSVTATGNFWTDASSVSGTIYAKNVTYNSVDLKMTRSPSGPWSIYRGSTRIAYGANNSSYGYWTHPNLSPSTSYVFYLYDAQTSSGNILDWVNVTTSSAPVYTVTANFNGGSCSNYNGWTQGSGGTYATKSVTSGNNVGGLPVVSKNGYSFAGWYNGSTRIYSTTTVTSSFTMTASWDITSITISFNANGGSEAPSSVGVEWDDSYSSYRYKITTAAPTRAGYKFKGWAYSKARADAGTIDYYAGYTYSFDDDTTLYAVWVEDYTYQTRLSTYDDEGNTISVGGSTKSGTSNTYTLSTPTKEPTSSYKYKFKGWSTSAGGSVSTTSMSITVSSTDYHGSSESGTVITYYKNLYAVFEATSLMGTFSWTSNDAANVVAGKDPSNVITASRWNNYLRSKIATLCSYYGVSNQTYEVAAGSIMTKWEYNSARNTLSDLATTTGGTQPPSTVDGGEVQTTSQFLGLKNALNSIINIFNSR